MSTVGQRMTRAERKEMERVVAESQYHPGRLYAPVQFKADADDSDFMKPVKFHGFGNTGKGDLGFDIVDPSAFTNETLNEFIKYGRQLFFMHDPYSQIGEITQAKRWAKGKRNFAGVMDGGLHVEGFVDSPVDPELGYVPDHPLAKIIHFARMQVNKNRLKLLSIGWRPTKSKMIKAPDPRRGNQMMPFRKVTGLILGEISMVTMAMNPQSITELQKAYEANWGQEISDALFSETYGVDQIAAIPEKVDDFTEERLRDVVVGAVARAALNERKATGEHQEPDEEAENPKYNLMSLDDLSSPSYRIIHLNQEK